MRKRSRIERVLLVFLLVVIILSCFFSATVASGNVSVRSMSVKPKNIGRCKAVDFNDSCTITLGYIWYKEDRFEGVYGSILLLSDGINFDKKEFTDKEFWNDSYEDGSEHELSIELKRDMIKEEMGTIEFRMEYYMPDYEGICECSSVLYYNVEGNKICFSENEGVVEGYFAKRDLAICAIVMVSVIVLFVIVKFIRKIYDKYLWKKHTGEE